jgi:signal transduction histidine kinase
MHAMHETLSHGLRTPLTSVLGYAATLLDHWEELDDADRVLFVRILYGEALRMAHSVEQVDRELYDGLLAGLAERSGAIKPQLELADAG